MQPSYNKRLDKLRERIKKAEIDTLLVSDARNIFYLSGSNGGYTGAKVMLIVDANTSTLIIDKRYLAETMESAVVDTITAWTEPSYGDIVALLKGSGVKKVWFESTHVTVKQYERLVKEFDAIQLVGVAGLIEPVREVKDRHEITKITDAAAIGDTTFDYITGILRPGMTEIEISIEIDFFMRKHGAERPSFDTIVASGIHSAVPHATPSSKKIEVGDFVTLDFGAVVDGYHSDMTRTVVIGRASGKQKDIYAKVLEAQIAALDAVVPGKVCRDLDAVARDIIAEAGYGENFVHSLGHGVGLDVHEAPTLAKGNEAMLAEAMVVTVEPGIYINGFGGVRIEDLVVVTRSGREVLTLSTKDLLEL